jgi:hypothetical protein
VQRCAAAASSTLRTQGEWRMTGGELHTCSCSGCTAAALWGALDARHLTDFPPSTRCAFYRVLPPDRSLYHARKPDAMMR